MRIFFCASQGFTLRSNLVITQIFAFAPEAPWKLAGGEAKRNHRTDSRYGSAPRKGRWTRRDEKKISKSIRHPCRGAISHRTSTGGSASLHHRLISSALSGRKAINTNHKILGNDKVGAKRKPMGRSKENTHPEGMRE